MYQPVFWEFSPMMNLNPFRKFLSNLSQISRWRYEIWDADKTVFSSGSKRSKVDLSEDLRQLAAKVISNGSFQHALSQGNYEFYGTPINNGAEVSGSLLAYAPIRRKEPKTTDSDDIKLRQAGKMEIFLASLVELIEDKWASDHEVEEITEELSQKLEDISLYSNVGTSIKTLRFSSTMLKDLAEQILGAMRTEIVFIRLPDRPEFDMLFNKKAIGDKISHPNAFVEALIQAMPEKVFFPNENYFLVVDSKLTPGYSALHSESFRFLAVRMQHKDIFYGWLGLISFDVKKMFRRSELNLMSSIVEQLALVLTNSDMYADLENLVINVVKSFVQAIEAKDQYTRGHSERVNRYVTAMAARLNLNEVQRKDMNWASVLHDIGKIGIPEPLLNKLGSLTDEEYRILKAHPEKGYNILAPLEQLSGALPGILHHHERYDGLGYPHGLKGEDIPFAARIIAIVDTYDAIITDRAYRAGRTVKEAIEILEKVAGSQLDPDLVEVFKEVLKEDPGIHEKNKAILAA
jgi:HD-GYP domain-containing protein (c-di-GMP phosphodiesterase class II)